MADPFARNHLIRDGINRAIYDEMANDANIHLFGEGAGVKTHYDAPFIEQDYPDRVHTLPISEDGNTNFAVGTALLGVKPIVDVISADFLYRTMDSICNTAAKINFLRQSHITMVIRAEFLVGGPTTGQRPEALFTHIPGLRVIIPSTPRDAYGMMRTALTTPGVTLFFEDRDIRDDLTSTADCRILGPIGFYAHERRNGNDKPDLTIVTYGLMRQVVEGAIAAEEAPKYEGPDPIYPFPLLNVDLIDLRSLYPIDWLAIGSSVRRSKSLLVIEPDVEYGGVGAEIVAQVAQVGPKARLRRLGGRREHIPASTILDFHVVPTEKEILDAIQG